MVHKTVWTFCSVQGVCVCSGRSARCAVCNVPFPTGSPPIVRLTQMQLMARAMGLMKTVAFLLFAVLFLHQGRGRAGEGTTESAPVEPLLHIAIP